jgi:hypothetical protein
MNEQQGLGTAVRIDLGERSYDILIGRGLLDECASFEGLAPATCAVIVTNVNVAPLYAARHVSLHPPAPPGRRRRAGHNGRGAGRRQIGRASCRERV